MKIHRFYAGNLLELMPDFPFKELNAVVLGGLKRVMSLKNQSFDYVDLYWHSKV